MIGNDVVDFGRALDESNWHRKGYLRKLFNNEEQLLIANSADPDVMVWLLWTMKEASYKIQFRRRHLRSFQPKKFICSSILIHGNSAEGEVSYEGRHYFSRSVLDENFVHTLSREQPDGFNEITVLLERDFSGSYDELLKNNQLQDYCIIKNEYNIPTLLNRITGERFWLSISHHGRFLSLVYLSANK